ncbi:MAG TPA: TSUP family transporter [Chitinophagaceae bacterium]|jgi:uncharacterized membrane protein YfcA|nr:TSUP family transporter [Chitinophagaceae bacterium]
MHVELYQLGLLCLAAFCAGFVDAIVGGGGLIQTPVALVLLPHLPVVNVIGSLKIPAFSGTSLAAAQYLRKVKLNWQLVPVICTIAFFASYAGSELLSNVSNSFMKPVLLVVLLLVALYTFSKKNFGQQEHKIHTNNSLYIYGIVIALVIGFYDGFIGPGTGSFLILAFISLLGFDFLHASAYAKLVNLATNLGSITLFILKGKVIWMIALPMAISNALGGALGANLAISKGNKFIRRFFLFIVTITLLRFAYDVLIKR